MREWCLWEIFADSARFKNHFFPVFQRRHYIFFSRHNGIRDLGKKYIVTSLEDMEEMIFKMSAICENFPQTPLSHLFSPDLGNTIMQQTGEFLVSGSLLCIPLMTALHLAQFKTILSLIGTAVYVQCFH